MPELLLEVRSEEIPAGAQRPAAEALARSLTTAIADAGLRPGDIACWSTPRRIAVRVSDLPAVRPASRIERRGPRMGAPDAAVDGFCRANGIERERLELRELSKGQFYFAVLEEPPVPAEQLLRDLLPGAVSQVPWQKSMRWGDGDFRWIRPLRGILCLFDGEAVTFELGGVGSGAQTTGHPFHAPESFTVSSFAEYSDELCSRRVLLHPDARRERILRDGHAAAARAGFTMAADDGLAEELAGLTEWPVMLLGRFDESFLQLPAEVLTTTMRRHQRYLPLAREDGTPAPAFLMAADVEAKDGGAAVIAGNERVLRARLQDAAFFWQGDRKIPLAEKLQQLEDVVFHAKLGSMADKARRLETLARRLCRDLQWEWEEAAAQAARLAKADLTTDLVGEFPELQGIVGGHLARAEGLRPEVGDAISEHYRPLGPHDRCPTGPVAALVALVDKLDTLVGFFWKGERPSGSGDPLALRRAALGLIRIALENDLRLSVDDLLQHALTVHTTGGDRDLPSSEFADVRRDLQGFLSERLRVHLRAAGARHDHVAATLEAGSGVFRDLPGLADRVSLLAEFLATSEGAALQALYRRAANIVKIESRKDDSAMDGPIDSRLFSQPEERDLHGAVQTHGRAALQCIRDDDFLGALERLSRLREPIDRFFDAVRVNAEDADLRANRLRLLASLEDTIVQAADFSKLEGGESGRHD